MLVYTTILLVSLVLATISIFIYRRVSSSSRSIYNSKQQIGIVGGTPGQQKDKVARVLPTERINDGPSTNGVQLAAQPHGHGTGVGKVSRCSLYDVNATKADVEDKQARREENPDAAVVIPGHTRGCSLYSSQ
jgi:hypothetical protein